MSLTLPWAGVAPLQRFGLESSKQVKVCADTRFALVRAPEEELKQVSEALRRTADVRSYCSPCACGCLYVRSCAALGTCVRQWLPKLKFSR